MRIAVLGAGVAGLVAGMRLTEAGHTVDVYERWPGLGGQAATLDVGQGHLLERYYHHLFSTDRHIAALYEELGMEDELEWITSSVAYFTDGKQWPFVTPIDLLRFKPLPPLSRVRLGAAVLAIQRGPGNPAPFERVTARAWIERYMGRTPGARCGARCCAGSSASAPTTSRWCGCRTSSGCAAATTPPRRSSATRSTRGSCCSARCATGSRPAAGAC